MSEQDFLEEVKFLYREAKRAYDFNDVKPAELRKLKTEIKDAIRAAAEEGETTCTLEYKVNAVGGIIGFESCDHNVIISIIFKLHLYCWSISEMGTGNTILYTVCGWEY